MTDGGGPGDPEIAKVQEQTAFYEGGVPSEQRDRLRDAGVAEQARKLFWASSHLERDSDTGAVTDESKLHIFGILTEMEEKVDGMDESQKPTHEPTIRNFVGELTVNGDGETPLLSVLIDSEPEGEPLSAAQKAAKLTEEGKLGEAFEVFKTGSPEDIAPVELLKSMQEDPDKRTPENIQKLKAFYEQKGLPKEELEQVLKSTSLDAATQAEILNEYNPREQSVEPEEPSQKEIADAQQLVKLTQEQTKHVDTMVDTLPEEERGPIRAQLAAMKDMLSKFNDRFNGKPEKYGKLGLKIALGTILALIIFIIWQMNVINKFSGKRR